MPELIDRQAALRLCKDADWEDDRIFIAGYNHAIRTMTQAITELPTIEPEVRHGRWILCEDQHGVDNDNNNYAYFCSQCHYQDVHSKYAKVNFCWNCGAKMLTDLPEPPEKE